MLPWAHPSAHPKQLLDQFSCFCRAHDRDRQIDSPRYYVVTIGHMYVCSTAMQPNNADTTSFISSTQITFCILVQSRTHCSMVKNYYCVMDSNSQKVVISQASKAACDEVVVFCSWYCRSSDMAPSSHVVRSIFCTRDFCKRKACAHFKSKRRLTLYVSVCKQSSVVVCLCSGWHITYDP